MRFFELPNAPQLKICSFLAIRTIVAGRRRPTGHYCPKMSLWQFVPSKYPSFWFHFEKLQKHYSFSMWHDVVSSTLPKIGPMQIIFTFELLSRVICGPLGIIVQKSHSDSSYLQKHSSTWFHFEKLQEQCSYAMWHGRQSKTFTNAGPSLKNPR